MYRFNYMLYKREPYWQSPVTYNLKCLCHCIFSGSQNIQNKNKGQYIESSVEWSVWGTLYAEPPIIISIILILCTVGYFFSSKKVIRERKAHFSETKGIGA